jgi:hypothetical protein
LTQILAYLRHGKKEAKKNKKKNIALNKQDDFANEKEKLDQNKNLRYKFNYVF